jgi:hypothetical protein
MVASIRSFSHSPDRGYRTVADYGPVQSAPDEQDRLFPTLDVIDIFYVNIPRAPATLSPNHRESPMGC